MDKKEKIGKVEAKEVLDYNLKRIYRLSVNKYPYLYKVLRGELGEFLRNIINFWKSKDGAILSMKRDAVYFLGTHKGTYTVRKKTTKSVTNKWLNYLCAIGLLNKEVQPVLEGGYDRRVLRNLTGVNRNMLAYNYNDKIEPINTFRVEKYTTEFLLKCNENARRLLEKNITPGNISYNQLALNGLKDIAIITYRESRGLAENKKLREYQKLLSCIDSLIEKEGYTTKQRIYEECDVEALEIDKLFKIFKNELWKTRCYKIPNREEMEKYNLKTRKYIIINK